MTFLSTNHLRKKCFQHKHDKYSIFLYCIFVPTQYFFIKVIEGNHYSDNVFGTVDGHDYEFR